MALMQTYTFTSAVSVAEQSPYAGLVVVHAPAGDYTPASEAERDLIERRLVPAERAYLKPDEPEGSDDSNPEDD